MIRTMLKRCGSQGEGRYYYGNWKRFLDEEDIELYRKSCGREPDGRAGIRVYFDDEGYLIIQYCPVESIEAKIEKGMHGWYRWAVKEARGMEYSPVNIGHLAIGYAEEIFTSEHSMNHLRILKRQHYALNTDQSAFFSEILAVLLMFIWNPGARQIHHLIETFYEILVGLLVHIRHGPVIPVTPIRQEVVAQSL